MMLQNDRHLGSRCSRAGCQAPADFAINWRNPKIHSVDRVKVWHACRDHRDYLAAFLEARSFPVAVEPFMPPAEEVRGATKPGGHDTATAARE